MNEELKPCPLCGGYPPVSFVLTDDFLYLVRLARCMVAKAQYEYGVAERTNND